jgi:L-aspartate oxidase
MNYVQRYLTSFYPKQIPHFFTDVLVIGGGLAGLRAANAVDSQLNVLVITKDAVAESNSNYAQGGIASVLDPDDSFQEHVSDTLVAGGSLCHADVVEMVVREAPQHIHELMQWGTNFDEAKNGQLLLGREGGHSHNRIVHALGDSTGKEVMRAVIAHTLSRTNIQIWEKTFTLDLLTHSGACRGAIISRQSGGKIMVWARQTILATGGCGQIYRESTNPLVATGDGHALAYRAGAELRDMEFIQFHPTVLYIAGGSRSLITEAARGEGGRLVDKLGHRFMPEYDDRAELAPRDIVSRAIVTQMEKTQHPCVYLDLSHLNAAFVKQRFPGIGAACAKFGIDITTDRIPVRPGAHYMIGGVTVDLQGRTTIPNLWAAGEVTSSGLHGANRLASNSLLEGLVYGTRAGQGASQAALHISNDLHALPLENAILATPIEALDIADIRNSLKALMWRAAGVRRHGAALLDALSQVQQWQRYVLVRQFDDSAGWELQNLLTLSRIIIEAALKREESRGVHLRLDFPETNNAVWNQHITCQRNWESDQ